MKKSSSTDGIPVKKMIKIKFKWKLLRSLKYHGSSSIFYFLGAILLIAYFLLMILILNIRLIYFSAIFLCITVVFPYILKYRKSISKEYNNIKFNLLVTSNKWSALSKVNKIISLLFLIILLVTIIFYIINFLNSNSVLLLLVLSLFLFMIGFSLEVVQLVKDFWDGFIFKNIFKFLVILATTISLILSRNFINLITKVDSSHFPIAISIFTLSLTPVAWMLLSILILFCFYTITLILMMTGMGLMYLKDPIKSLEKVINSNRIYCFFFGVRRTAFFRSKKYSFLMWIARSSGAAIVGYSLFSLLFFFTGNYNLYQKQIYSLASQGIVYSSYQSISGECKNHNSGEWIVLIGNNKASIATKNNSGSFEFEARNCE